MSNILKTVFFDNEYLDKDCDQHYDFDGVFAKMMVEIDNNRWKGMPLQWKIFIKIIQKTILAKL